MQKRRRHQQRHESRVFNRIPGPVTAPAQLHIRPRRAKQVAHAQKEPSQESPFPGQANPAVVQIFAYQGRHRKGKRNSETHVSQIQRWGMYDHPVVLQEGVQPPAIFRRQGNALKRIGGKIEQ